jgi:hypothetical protein
MFRTAKTVGQVPVHGRKVARNELPDKNHVTFIKVKELRSNDYFNELRAGRVFDRTALIKRNIITAQFFDGTSFSEES